MDATPSDVNDHDRDHDPTTGEQATGGGIDISERGGGEGLGGDVFSLQGDVASRSEAMDTEGDGTGDVIDPGVFAKIGWGPPKQKFGEYDRNSIDLVALVTSELGRAPIREGASRHWWQCPFHQDNNPSFCVDTEQHRWRCWTCGASGDAADLVQRLRGLSFTAAKDYLREHKYITATAATPASSAKGPGKPAAKRWVVSEETALRIAREGVRCLWGAGELAGAVRTYLNRDRGLTDEMIKRVGIGYAEDYIRWLLPVKAAGLIIPWAADPGNHLVKLVVKQPKGLKPSYRIIYHNDPSVYPRLSSIVPGRPLIVVEGELDCLLMRQELGDLASIITTGSGSSPPKAAVLEAARSATVVFAALDADDTGDNGPAAKAWDQEGATRIRPPQGKDWTESRLRHVNLREFWSRVLP
jgi:DNA primase